jgi:hypothetical protein
MNMREIRRAIELMEDAAMAGEPIDQHRLMALMRERIRQFKAGLASLRYWERWEKR